MKRSELKKAIRNGVEQSGLSLKGANLRGLSVKQAKLSGQDLRGADLSYATLREADLRGADLRGANLSWANLRGADLSGAGLRGADLANAKLIDARLVKADLVDANLDRAKLDSADLSGAAVTHEQLAQALSLAGATLPEGTISVAGPPAGDEGPGPPLATPPLPPDRAREEVAPILCPQCGWEGFNPFVACQACQFSGDPSHLFELGHVAYLLQELDTWEDVPLPASGRLRTRYQDRRQELEVALGLRPPPLTGEEIRALWWEFFCLGALREEAQGWLSKGWVHPEAAERLDRRAAAESEALRQQLEGAPPSSFHSSQDRLELFDYLEECLHQAQQRGDLVNDEAHTAARSDLQARRAALEIEVGLRPRPVAVTPEIPQPVPVAKAPAPPPKPARPPREPITWDRILETFLSERTLNVLLFLGAFLLVAAALTYVIYNWERLPAAAQLAAIVLFTLSFYAAGWFLRVKMELRLSGIAVTAVAALLVPVDFYAVGIAGGAVPAEDWPWVWLVASVVCLPLYLFVTLRIRAEFFVYLVSVATGSLLCSVLQVLGAPMEWWMATLVALALSQAALSYRLRETERTWSLFAGPLRFSALVATSAILPTGIGWWIATGASGFHFDASLALAWAVGAVLYAYTAARDRSPLLGRVAATALPGALFLLLRLAFQPLGIEHPWYALGWAALAPIYLWLGHRYHARARETTSLQTGDAEGGLGRVLRAHGRTATGWGLALMAAAAVWSVFDLWAAAATHALLVAGAALAVRLWERPRALPGASALAFSSATFAMAAGHLEPAELCLGWALLALLHIFVAHRLRAVPDYASRLFAAGLVASALALLPPLILAHEPLLTYSLGHWIAFTAWLVWLEHTGEHAGLQALLDRFGPLRQSVLHWLIALPQPFFVTMLYTRFRPPDAWLGLLVAGLAWSCFAIARLRRRREEAPPAMEQPALFALNRWSFPWYAVGYACSLAAPILALVYDHRPILAVAVLLASALYFASAWVFRIRWWLIPAGLALPLGLVILLDFWAVPGAQQSLILAAVVAMYLLGGVGCERRLGVARRFFFPLDVVAHLLALFAVGWGLAPAAEALVGSQSWPDPARLWAAGGQLILGAAYGLYAWFLARERWAHAAAWLGVMAGGLIATAYSQGRGSSAFKAALLAAVYILAERALATEALQHRWALARRAWPLYRRALLIAGWAVSAGAIGLALVRNLALLGGGRIQAIWAIAGLLAITALYALSARLFRRPLFIWLAGGLVVAPWTLLTAWGWFLWSAPPPLPRFALSWAVLACLELLLGLALASNLLGWPILRRAEREHRRQKYGFPLRFLSHLLLPFALLWGIADSATSSLTWGLGLAFYLLSTAADHRRGLTGWRAARFLYPSVAVALAWALYLLNHFWPAAPYESYGLLLLAFTLPLLALGRWLQRVDRADSMPLYLGAYGAAVIGTLLVAHQRPLLAAALAYDTLLCVLSARIFRQALWGYPATALAPAAMLVALAESQVPPDRRGWWLIGLGALYLLLAWILRRQRQHSYAIPLLAASFAVVALGLPPSSLDNTGAFCGYLAAALIYAAGAAWLRQPLLLLPTAALLAVPYGVALIWLEIGSIYYGLAVFPGAVVALVLAHLLDWRLGRPGAIFPTLRPKSWQPGRLLDWWAAPFYAWGYVGALVAVGLSLGLRSGQAWADATRQAIALGLAATVFLHATVRFRSRGYLLLAGVLAQGAALSIIDGVGWLAHPAWAALAFLPVTLLTAALALAVERRRGEGSPLSSAWWQGANGLALWSRPLYLLLAVDLLAGQAAALFQAEPGAAVTLAHALLLAVLASVWAQPQVPYAAAGLGILGFFQAMAWAGVKPGRYPISVALLAVGYIAVGYGVGQVLRRWRHARIWRTPMEWAGLALSVVALLWAAVTGLDVASLVVRTLLGRQVTFADYASQVQVAMWVLALVGLLYLATAVVRRWMVLGYAALALLLGAWSLWWRFFLSMVAFQWYAVAAGLYLLGVGWMEWRQGRRGLARWVDRAGMLVWLGTAWWQSLPGVVERGWVHALIMGAESLLLIWWGSARRLKRFLYVGAVAVVVNAITQAIEPLLSVNRWIVFGTVGFLLVTLAILVERRLERIRELSAEWQGRMGEWE